MVSANFSKIIKKIQDYYEDCLCKNRVVYVAFSGGLDSSILLYLCAQVIKSNPQASLQAIHINHQVSQASDTWEVFCQNECDRYGIPLTTIAVEEIKPKKASLEAFLREQRYLAFSKILDAGDVLLTAQHLDDQVETFFLQLLRGAGLAGLSSMPFSKTQRLEQMSGVATHHRPLLSVTKKGLLSYAQENKILWVEDDSNQSEKFDRNYFRHQISPLLAARFPGYVQTIARSISHIQQANDEVSHLMRTLAPLVIDDANLLMIDAVKKLSAPQQLQMIRYWLKSQGASYPSQKKLMQLQHMLKLDEDQKAEVVWGDNSVRRFANRMYLLNKECADNVRFTHWGVDWDMKSPLLLPNNRYLKVAGDFDMQTVSVRFRRGGEHIRIFGKSHHQALKKLLQQWRIPPWERNRIPLVFSNDDRTLLAIADFATVDGKFWFSQDLV